VLIRSPELMTAYRIQGDYLRLKPSIGTKLSELIILVTSREWTQDYEWYVHEPIAVKAGIGQEICDAIADRRRPTGMREDEEIVYDFASELLRNRRVSDRTFDRADKRFGKKGVVDLTGIVGYYTFLAMQLNAAKYVPPTAAKLLPRFPEPGK